MRPEQEQAVQRAAARLDPVREGILAAAKEEGLPGLYREMLQNIARRIEGVWVAFGRGGPVDTSSLPCVEERPPTPFVGRVRAFPGDRQRGKKSPAAVAELKPCGVCWGCAAVLPVGYGGSKRLPLYCGSCRWRGSRHGWCACGSALYANDRCKPQTNEATRHHMHVAGACV